MHICNSGYYRSLLVGWFFQTINLPLYVFLGVAARHMRQLRPGLRRASPVILGKRNFLSENEIKFVSPYMSVIIRGECLAH